MLSGKQSNYTDDVSRRIFIFSNVKAADDIREYTNLGYVIPTGDHTLLAFGQLNSKNEKSSSTISTGLIFKRSFKPSKWEFQYVHNFSGYYIYRTVSISDTVFSDIIHELCLMTIYT